MINNFLKTKGLIDGKARFLAVTKGKNSHEILPLLRLGHKIFGESRIQEAKLKWLDLRQEFPEIKLHMIGHLQTNKVKDAIELFDVIETLDSEKLAIQIAKQLQLISKQIDLLIEVNIGSEKNKYGVNLNEIDEFIDYCKVELQLPIKGIMIIPPKDEAPKYFFNLAYDIAKRNQLPEISMGMSNDFIQAIECGSTEVRIGRSIF